MRSLRSARPDAGYCGSSLLRLKCQARSRRSSNSRRPVLLVSVGHTDATAAQVGAAAGRGARMVTHLFNAQRPLGHREPGVVGQALTDERLTSGLIVDLHHVAQAVCGLAFRAAPGRILLVTDAVAAAGMPPGEYLLGGELISFPADDGAPPVRRDGTIAGSALRMDRAVANAVRSGLTLPAAVAAASRIPADLIGRPDHRQAPARRGGGPGLAGPGAADPRDVDSRPAGVYRWRRRHPGRCACVTKKGHRSRCKLPARPTRR